MAPKSKGFSSSDDTDNMELDIPKSWQMAKDLKNKSKVKVMPPNPDLNIRK